MHELALAQSVIDGVSRAAADHGIQRIERIRLVIGALSGVMPDALSFGLEVLGQGTVAEGAVVEIEQRPIEAVCRRCGRAVEMDEWQPICPDCGAMELEIQAGDELRLESFEGE